MRSPGILLRRSFLRSTVSHRAPATHLPAPMQTSGMTSMELPRRRLLYLSLIAVATGFVIALAAPTASDAAEIKVLTTRAMNHVLTELAGAFQRTSEHKV